MEDKNNVWATAKELIKEEVTDLAFNAWINRMEICFLDDSNVVFKVPNISIKESIISRFSELLKEALHMVTNHDLL